MVRLVDLQAFTQLRRSATMIEADNDEPRKDHKKAPLLGGASGGVLLARDLRRLGFDQRDQMVDDRLILEPMMRLAGDVDHMRAIAAAGETDIGLARLAGSVDDAADDRD